MPTCVKMFSTGISASCDRHDQQRDDAKEERVAAGERHPGEGVGGEGGDEHGRIVPGMAMIRLLMKARPTPCPLSTC